MAHALLIGGTKGLGKVVANDMSLRGDTVSIIGRNKSDFDSDNIHSYGVDITDYDNIRNTINKIIDKNGPLNYCIFLQRYRGGGDQWSGEIETTLSATKNIVECVSSGFGDNDNCIIMVGSVFSRYVGEGQALSYHIAKAGLEQMMRYYALNLGKKGVRVNGIMPFTFLKEESKEFYFNNKELMGLYEKITPLDRMGATEDCSNLIMFLCSPLASFITGQNILIDGGMSLHWPESLVRNMNGI
jgi:NAD(P)-dependent dehydrogenase (short-subunit alcohol dehydrogenase family)